MSEWIKCSEKLPAHDAYVLGLEKGFVVVFYDDGSKKWKCEEWIERKIEYWMEIPTPPYQEAFSVSGEEHSWPGSCNKDMLKVPCFDIGSLFKERKENDL